MHLRLLPTLLPTQLHILSLMEAKHKGKEKEKEKNRQTKGPFVLPAVSECD